MRSKIVLLMALFMGVITTILFFKYMQQFNADKVSVSHTVQVVTAKEQIDKNEIITADKLVLTNIPEKSVLPDTLTTLSQAEGKIASSMIAKGETILAHHIISENQEDTYVSRKVKEGYRAVSIGV
ncbi:MAG: Flp pilus assembly protein CpaB, partial [Bacillota bacterium]|nr:Flp pilus assembly protein CpaB [Bacillota bacterium]